MRKVVVKVFSNEFNFHFLFEHFKKYPVNFWFVKMYSREIFFFQPIRESLSWRNSKISRIFVFTKVCLRESLYT